MRRAFVLAVDAGRLAAAPKVPRLPERNARFDRYNIIAEADLRDAVLKTQAYVETLPSERKVVPLPATRQRYRR